MMSVRSVSSFLLILGASGSCLMTQECPLPGCIPRARTGANTSLDSFEPAPFTGPSVFNVCPQYKEVCCSNVQMEALFGSFAGIGAAFGSLASGGCPSCLANIATFWCAYACSPNQSDFMKVLNTSVRTDPISGQPMTVLNTAVKISNTTACAISKSCQGTARVKEFPPMQTCEGFFNYQGQTEAIQDGRDYIEFTFGNSSGAIDFPTSSCCNYDPNHCASMPPPYPAKCSYLPSNASSKNVSCPCSACTGMCSGGFCGTGTDAAPGGGGNAYPGLGVLNDAPLYGFDYVTVAVFYGIIAFLTVVITLARAMWAETASISSRSPATSPYVIESDLKQGLLN